MNPLENEINGIMAAYERGELNIEQKNYLISQIHDIRAEMECNNDYNEIKRIKNLCLNALAFIRL